MKLSHQLVLLTTLLAANFHNNVRADSQLTKTEADKHQVPDDLVSNIKRDDKEKATNSELVAQILPNAGQDSSNLDSDFDETKEMVMIVPVSSSHDSTINVQNKEGKPLTGNEGVVALEEIAVAETGYRQYPMPYYRQYSYYRPQQYYQPQYGYARPNPTYYNNNYYYSRPRPYNYYNYNSGYNGYGYNSYNSAPVFGFSIQG